MITILITLVIIGVVLWLIETQIPMDPAIKTIIRVIVILFILVWLLSAFGLINTPNLRLK